MQAQQVLASLADGSPVSGAELAERAGVSRAAIWKQVEILRACGVPVEARVGAGYRLPWPVQMLDAQAIRAELSPACRAALGTFEVHWALDSTSSELQRRGAGAPDASVLLAEMQTAGRGRRGREWVSPPGLNLHLSCLKRFEQGFAGLAGLSLAVGVMVLEAVESLGLRGAGLKWPNDVFSDAGKLAGILVELSGEYGGPCAAVVGVGLNVRLTESLREQAGQPVADLAGLAGGQPPERNVVAAALVSALVEGLQVFAHEGFAPFARRYARHDRLQGKLLRVSGATGPLEGTGAGVDARGALRLRLAGGSVRTIDSADVTVRPT